MALEVSIHLQSAVAGDRRLGSTLLRKALLEQRGGTMSRAVDLSAEPAPTLLTKLARCAYTVGVGAVGCC